MFDVEFKHLTFLVTRSIKLTITDRLLLNIFRPFLSGVVERKPLFVDYYFSITFNIGIGTVQTIAPQANEQHYHVDNSHFGKNVMLVCL